MTAEWYYAEGKEKVGPVTEAQLKELARSGKLARTDVVWKEGMAKWTEAGTVPGLFAVPTSAVSPPLPRTDSPLNAAWLKVYDNKPLFFGVAFGVAIVLGPVVSAVLDIFPDGLGSFLRLLYALLVIGLFGAFVVTGMSALNRATTRAVRETNLWGKWEPVSGQGCSLWFYQDGGFLRNDGFGAKYSFDPGKDIIVVNVDGLGEPVPLKVITITEHELIVDGGGRAMHFRKGKTITDERWEESVEKTKAFLTQAAVMTGAVTVGVVGVGVLVLGAAAATVVAAGGVAGAAAGSARTGGSEGGRNDLQPVQGEKPYRQVPCSTCNQKGWYSSGPAQGSTCDSCGGKGYILMK